MPFRPTVTRISSSLMPHRDISTTLYHSPSSTMPVDSTPSNATSFVDENTPFFDVNTSPRSLHRVCITSPFIIHGLLIIT